MVIQAMIELLYSDVTIEIVDNGFEALEKLKCESFDLLLSDIEMPVMDGYTLVIEVKKLGLTLPLISVTASAIKGDSEKILSYGFDDYISKPIDMEGMKVVLDKYIV
jgi:CheY-like chemotaxis protein